MIKKKKNLEKPKYLKDFSINLEMAQRMYRKTVTIHDYQLQKFGPYGESCRCNNEPFSSKMKRNVTLSEEVFEPILDRNTTFYYSPKWTRERFEKKRKNWNEVAEDTKENKMREFIAPMLQGEALCNGTEIRVRI